MYEGASETDILGLWSNVQGRNLGCLTLVQVLVHYRQTRIGKLSTFWTKFYGDQKGPVVAPISVTSFMNVPLPNPACRHYR